MVDPLFSILIANYNNGKFIPDAINSIIEQTYKNIEIIFVDDFSNDNSIHEIEKFKLKNMFIYKNSQNFGCGYTKRKCIEKCNGEIAGFLDPDDLLKKNAIEIMVDEHIKNKDHSLIYSDIITCDENLNFTGFQKQIQIPENSSFLFYQSGSVSQFATFKTSLYKKTSGIDSKFKRAVDQDLYLKLEEVGKLKHVNIPLYIYRLQKNSISLNKNYSKAYTWNLIARIDACNRRDIDVEEVIPKMIDSVEDIKEFYINSSDWKIGSSFLKPIRIIKSLLGFYKN